MRILHTADWHAGRTLHGRSRTEEVRASLAALADIACESADVVLVSGDLYDSPTPSAEAEQAVYEFFHTLATEGVPAVVIAGNHDSPDRIDAVANVLALARVHAIGTPRTRSKGGRTTIATRAGDLQVATLPFISHRRLIRSQHLLGLGDDGQRVTYQEGMRTLFANLTAGMDLSVPSVFMFHGTMDGATLSSEYTFHSVDAYAVPGDLIPPWITYAALGHIHVPQPVAGMDSDRARYPGSLIQLDFGDAGYPRGALMVTIDDLLVQSVEPIHLTNARPLIVADVTPDTVAEWTTDYRTPGAAYVKLRVHLPEPRPGMKERLHREGPDVIAVDFILPEHERPEPVRIDAGEVDFERAFREYMVDQRGAEPSPDLAAAFQRVDHATTPKESA